MITILAFGINGFTGKHFEKYVQTLPNAKEFQFIGVDVLAKSSLVSTIFKYLECDILDKERVQQIIVETRPTFILNFVGTFTATSLDDYYSLNVRASENILDACVKSEHKIEKILLIGSAAEYGIPKRNPIHEEDKSSPINLYGITKLFQTELALFYFRAFKIPVVVARTFNIIGEGISNKLSVGNFIKEIDNASDGDTINVGNLDSSRDFLDAASVVMHYWHLTLHGTPGEIYNVCSGKPTKIKDLLEKLITESGRKLKYKSSESLVKSFEVSEIFGSNEKLEKSYANSARSF